LAWGDAHDGDDACRDPGSAEWQSRQLDEKGQRRTTPSPSNLEVSAIGLARINSAERWLGRIEVLNSAIMLDVWQFHNGKGKIAARRE
jgi:hypothetical protein